MILTIVGPTGVGKSKLSIALAKKYNAVIINADAVQMYKEFNIGTAKITKDEMEGVPHYLIDFLDPSENYSIYDYQKKGRELLNKFINENRSVIIVGGSGLYIKALLYDYNFSEEKKSIYDFEKYSNEELKKRVDNIFKDNNIHVNNRKRLVRFLEKYNETGKIIKNENKDKLLYDTIFIGLTTNRENLYEIINNRVEVMFNNSLLEEAKNLFDKKIKRVNEIIGYKELNDYFLNKISLEEAKNKIKQNSRRYAKRQYTWFKNQMDIKWFDVNYDDFNKTVLEVENYIEKTND